MNKHIFYDGGTPFRRIDKRKARAAFDAGKPVILCPVNLHPFGSFRPSCMVQKGDDGRTFDAVNRDFMWHNCSDRETGLYSAFYINDEVR